MKAKKIVFKTKDGREVAFKKVPGVKKKETKLMKALDKRLSAMEKAVSHYNVSVKEYQEKRKKEKKERKAINLTSLVKAKTGPKKKAETHDSDSD